MRKEAKKSEIGITEYDADKPAAKDLFGRRPFAEKVAEIILERPLGEPLVVSLVGEWGSGKSTAMGYVHDRLATSVCKIAEFNPWRYSGEDMMLYELFAALVKAIDPELHVLTSWQRIKNGIDKRIDAVKSIVDATVDLTVGGGGGVAGGVVGIISSNLRTDIEAVRDQAREHLEKSKWRVVILLDDIDRLEAVEILTLFRLIKLTCDLPNTTFVLAMDENHVSQVIGQRIDGTQTTGRDYIEKIVNVRLALPNIPDYKLRGFTLRLFDSILEQSGQSLSSEESVRCAQIFDGMCFSLIKTPRKAKSLANAYRFAIGLLPGQVNPGDLMLLECIRLLRPDLHKAILTVIPRMMKGDTAENYLATMFSDEKERGKLKNRSWNQILSSLGKVPESESEDVKKALQLWFPQLDANQSYEDSEIWKQQKRICSRSYFWRYLSAAIQDDDVRDDEVQNWVFSLQDLNIHDSKSELIRHLKSSHAEAFIAKLDTEVHQSTDYPRLLVVRAIALAAKEMVIDSKSSLVESSGDSTARIAAFVASSLGAEQGVVSIAEAAINDSQNFQWSWIFVQNLPDYCKTKRINKDGIGMWQPAKVEQMLANKVLDQFSMYPPTTDESVCHMVWLICRNQIQGETKKRVTEMISKRPELAHLFLAGGCNYSGTPLLPGRCWMWKGVKSLDELEQIVELKTLHELLSSKMDKLAAPQVQKNIPLGDRDYETIQEIGRRFIDLYEKRADGNLDAQC